MENQFKFKKFNEDGLPVYSKNNAVKWYMSQGMSELEGIEMVENDCVLSYGVKRCDIC